MNDKMKFLTTCILVPLLAAMGCRPACAQEVGVPEEPPAVEDFGGGGPGGLDAWTFAAGGRPETLELALADTGMDPALLAVDGGTAMPLAIQGGTGRDWQMGVDPRGAAAVADREGWPWWGKALVIGGCVVVAGLATWAIVEACDGGSHSSGDDSSTHYHIGVNGSGNRVDVRFNSPNSTSATTTTSETTTTTTGGLE